MKTHLDTAAKNSQGEQHPEGREDVVVGCEDLTVVLSLQNLDGKRWPNLSPEQNILNRMY